MPQDRRDLWDFLTLGLWFLFFLVGLVPELAFYAFREIAAVPPFTAVVNSSAAISLTFAAYMAFFAHRSCRDAGLKPYMAQGKALEVGLLALVAFLEIPAKGFAFEARTLLAILIEIDQIPDRYLQAVILFVGTSKLVAWSYLLSLVIRYHAFGVRRVFTTIPSLFPSMHSRRSRQDKTPQPADISTHRPTPLEVDLDEPPVDPGRGVTGK